MRELWETDDAHLSHSDVVHYAYSANEKRAARTSESP
jgi:hypothetical protein